MAFYLGGFLIGGLFNFFIRSVASQVNNGIGLTAFPGPKYHFRFGQHEIIDLTVALSPVSGNNGNQHNIMYT